MGLGAGPAPVQAEAPATGVILLDTNAVIWIHQNHPRTRHIADGDRLYVSPVTVLELQILTEAGRLRLKRGRRVRALIDDGSWLLDDPPATAWFTRALDLGWTRDPFDRLIVAHAQLRGWRLASSDPGMLAQMSPSDRIEL